MGQVKRGNPQGSKGSWSLTNIYLLLGVFVVAWCLITPIILVNKFQPNLSAEQLIRSSRNGKSNQGVDLATGFESQANKSSPPPSFHIVEPKLWTLDHASYEEVDGLNWLEKGKLIIEKNLLYLHQSEGKATRPESNITLVSGMLDLGRGDLQESFKRSFQHYVDRFSNFLAYKFPKIIFIQSEHYELFKPYFELNKDYPIYIVNTTIQDVINFKFYDKIQKVRTDPKWANQAGWLSESPQATMHLYNPMVMSKLLWTRYAAQLNPFNTDAFLWFDGGHLCNSPNEITQEKTEVFKRHFDKLLITYFDYQPYGEIHGFKEKEFRKYINSKDSIVRVGRGGVFGGTKEYIEVASEVYMLALEETLDHHLMGTEENIFSILHYRFPELVHDYENGEGGNCAIFSEAIYGPPPPPVEQIMVEKGLDLRNATCVKLGDGKIECQDNQGRTCPAYATPKFLSIAENQYSCNLPGRYCTVDCKEGQVWWYSHNCKSDEPCPPYPRVPYRQFYNDAESIMRTIDAKRKHDAEKHIVKVHYYKEDDVSSMKKKLKFTKAELAFWEEEKKKIDSTTLAYVKEHGVDLRGLNCEIKDGKSVCFVDHPLQRDLCPESVTPMFLATAPRQYSCQNNATYCTVSCQEGTNQVAWHAFQKEWCGENPEHCPPRPPVIPFDEFALKNWSLPPPVPKKCDSIPLSTFRNITPFSVVVLARGTELDSLKHSLDTWEETGFIQSANEFLFFINEQTPEADRLLAPYKKAPYKVKVIGSPENEGLFNGLKWVIGNATYEHVLFLEKDFRMEESLSCALEQLSVGLNMIDTGVADVVKYRSRYRGGHPNWADILYRDKEETVFEKQPNLLCNFYHWIDHPETRWPQHFKICSKDPLFYCVDAEFCNWTNNPFLITKTWWNENYMKKFKEFVEPPPGFDLETFMNWHPGAWNDRGWTVAEGDGMFRHADVHKFGV